MNHGREVPVAYYSRSLTKTERNYSQLDKEALAIIASVKKFHYFLYGFEFEIVTDHKPLLGLFDKNRPTPEIMSSRMLRWNHLLSAYNYNLKHRAGVTIPHADALSRLPLTAGNSPTPPLHEVFLLEFDRKLNS